MEVVVVVLLAVVVVVLAALLVVEVLLTVADVEEGVGIDLAFDCTAVVEAGLDFSLLSWTTLAAVGVTGVATGVGLLLLLPIFCKFVMTLVARDGF